MENNNYGFNFDPNKVTENMGSTTAEKIEKKIADKDGGFSVSANSDGKPLGGNFRDTNYVIANHKSKTKVRKMNAGSNIGKGSNGFAGVATLATIIAVAGIIIAYFVLKY